HVSKLLNPYTTRPGSYCFVTASEIFLRFGQQSHLVVSCVCAFIEGTSPSMLADCLGLDPSKFKSSEVANNDRSGSVMGVANDEERSVAKLVKWFEKTENLLEVAIAEYKLT
nr:DNA polymerase alpha catalytic subunit [Tanacetum cinerariifolium]